MATTQKNNAGKLTTAKSNRRHSSREIASYSTTIYDQNGRELAKGRMGNLSQFGAFVITKMQTPPRNNDQITVEINKSTATDDDSQDNYTSTIRVPGRVVRVVTLGQLAGIGIELFKEYPL